MNEIEKQIEEMAKILKSYCCLIGGTPTKGDCYQCKQAYASCYNYAEHIYNAGYRNVKDKVVLDKEEYNIIDHNIKHLETLCDNLEKERSILEEELAKASELKAETIKLAKQETARELTVNVENMLIWVTRDNNAKELYEEHLHKELKIIAKEYGVEYQEDFDL